MNRHYNDPFDTQVTPEEFEQFHVDVDDETLHECSVPAVKGRPLPASIDEPIEDDMDDSFEK